MDVRASSPGDAKYEARGVDAVLDVKNAVAIREESSVGVKAVPAMEVEVGFSIILMMYFAFLILTYSKHGVVGFTYPSSRLIVLDVVV